MVLIFLNCMWRHLIKAIYIKTFIIFYFILPLVRHEMLAGWSYFWTHLIFLVLVRKYTYLLCVGNIFREISWSWYMFRYFEWGYHVYFSKMIMELVSLFHMGKLARDLHPRLLAWDKTTGLNEKRPIWKWVNVLWIHIAGEDARRVMVSCWVAQCMCYAAIASKVNTGWDLLISLWHEINPWIILGCSLAYYQAYCPSFGPLLTQF